MEAKTIKSDAVLISAEELEAEVINVFAEDMHITADTSVDKIRFWAGQKEVLDCLRRLISEKRGNPLAT